MGDLGYRLLQLSSNELQLACFVGTLLVQVPHLATTRRPCYEGVRLLYHQFRQRVSASQLSDRELRHLGKSALEIGIEYELPTKIKPYVSIK